MGPDCADSARTTCRLRQDSQQQRALIGSADVDWYRVELRAGRSYTLAVEIGVDIAPVFELVDRAGRRVALGRPPRPGSSSLEIAGFTPSRSGDYYAVVRARFDDLVGRAYVVSFVGP